MSKQTVAKVNYAHITPAVLTWAITQSGRTREDIAGAIDVPVNVLAEWESATSVPTFDQAVGIAECFSIPLGYLFLSHPPHRKITVPDKRTLDRAKPFSANFRQLLTDVLVRQDWYRQHVTESGRNGLAFVGSASLSDDPLKVASDVRQALGLTADDRRHTYSWTDYLSRLSDLAEGVGILVMRSGVVGNTTRSIDKTEVQGFALADSFAPVVFVNASDFVSARIFTLAHELAHIWLGQSAITNPDQGESNGVDAVEAFCDKAATEILVPHRGFPTVWRQTPAASRIHDLVRKYWVSARVILRRARELNLISVDEYLALRDKAIAEETGKQKRKASYWITARARAGRRLTDAVLSEVTKGATPIVEGASLLSMSVNTFADFAEGRH